MVYKPSCCPHFTGDMETVFVPMESAKYESDKPDGRQFPLGRAFQRFEFLYLFMFWREGLRKVGESEEHRLLGSVGGLCHPWNVRITMWPGTRGSLCRGGCWQRPGRARGATVVNRPTEMAEEWAVKPWTSLELIHLLLAHCQGRFCLCGLPLLACCLCAANEPEPCQCSGRLWSAPPFSGCDKEIRQTAEMGGGGGLDGGLEGRGRLGKSLSSRNRLGHEQCCEQKHCTMCRGWGLTEGPSGCLPLPCLGSFLGSSHLWADAGRKGVLTRTEQEVKEDTKQDTLTLGTFFLAADCGELKYGIPTGDWQMPSLLSSRGTRSFQ